MSPTPIRHFHARQHQLILGHGTCLMGIVNCTPDSFSHDGQWNGYHHTNAIKYALKLIKQGAHLIDVGGESTRPGAKPVSEAQELKRVIPVIEYLATHAKVPISIDTYKPKVALAALKAGASIVNTVKGTQINRSLINIVKKYDAGLILMHSRGTPQTMMNQTMYKSIVLDIMRELNEALKKCLDLGLKKDRIMIDPGIGFAKSIEGNLTILNELEKFHSLNCALMVGPSRKSFIGTVLNKDVTQRVWGTAATVSAAIMQGAHVIRVHDIKQMADVAIMTDAIKNKTYATT